MLFGQEHVRRYLQTDGAEGHEWQGTTVLILTTTGRRSGDQRSTPLIYGKHGDDYVVVASKGGAEEHPAWYLNLSSEPEVTVQVRGDRFKARARTAAADREARAVEADDRPLASLRRLSGQDEPRHSGRRARARGVSRSGEDWSARRLHFVGIGGAGMSGLAIIARELGASVTGSDRARSSYTERLLEHGIEPTLGHRADNVPAGAEVVFSTAVPPDNPERRAAAGRELHRSDLLAQIAALRRCLAVTGTHGKTTTAAMIVHILRGCGLDPAYVVGGELGDTGVNAGWGAR